MKQPYRGPQEYQSTSCPLGPSSYDFVLLDFGLGLDNLTTKNYILIVSTSISFLAPWSRSPMSHSVCLSVCPSGTSLSRALNLHLSLIGQSKVSLRSVSGQSQDSLRSVLVLSELTSSRRSLKYFVLLFPLGHSDLLS